MSNAPIATDRPLILHNDAGWGHQDMHVFEILFENEEVILAKAQVMDVDPQGQLIPQDQPALTVLIDREDGYVSSTDIFFRFWHAHNPETTTAPAPLRASIPPPTPA